MSSSSFSTERLLKELSRVGALVAVAMAVVSIDNLPLAARIALFAATAIAGFLLGRGASKRLGSVDRGQAQ